MSTPFRQRLSFLIIFLTFLTGISAFGDTPVITAARIEADWLRQDAVWGQRDTVRKVAEMYLTEDEKAALAKEDAVITPEKDAAGGVDGRIDGRWGFHTQNEEQPWWQVDLGRSMPLDRVVLYNRCDGNMAKRNGKIIVLLSQDGAAFEQAYQHDGGVFLGYPDGKPLVVQLDNRKARYVRLQLPGKSFFHLDEVEVYAADSGENVALGKPATQSSVSKWSHTDVAP